ncbi:hypothetical protein KYC5002_49310 [Archangium violaceum]|nr:hypothetical protein KYC5002_49310 [Archangium gephyra]
MGYPIPSSQGEAVRGEASFLLCLLVEELRETRRIGFKAVLQRFLEGSVLLEPMGEA